MAAITLKKFLRYAKGRSPSLLAFKVRQVVSRSVLRRSGYWTRLSKRAWSLADSPGKAGSVLVAAEGIAAVRSTFQLNEALRDALDQCAVSTMRGEIEVFGANIKLSSFPKVDWHSDWRSGHRWALTFFADYDHYAPRNLPYDVKFPWELSRMGFLQPLALKGALTGDACYFDSIEAVLSDWLEQNPVAYGINWHPMECSMRAINLVLLTDLARYALHSSHPLHKLLRYLGLLHGSFLFRNLEYTDVRGNHYMANLVAMIALSRCLAGTCPETANWLAHAWPRFEQELRLQFSSDGVHFEKSIPYHRLVTQLGLAGLRVSEGADLEVSNGTRECLHKACSYTRAYVQPDGLSPIWGDNDEARVFCLDPRTTRDHRGLADWGALLFDDPSLLADPANSIEAPLLTGRTATGGVREATGATCFQDGGMLCYRNADTHFITDFGDIGLFGRGGHGHFDTLSFELFLRGHRVVLDPGSFVYTQNLERHRHYRSTVSHNIARPAGAEMGSFPGQSHWSLGNESKPYCVAFKDKPDGFFLCARHDGYSISNNVNTYQRCFEYSAKGEQLSIIDSFTSPERMSYERLLHFPPDMVVTIDGPRALLDVGTGRFAVEWDAGTAAELTVGAVSYHYGSEQKSSILVLKSTASGPLDLRMIITVL